MKLEKSGEVIKTFGKRGRGPEEFSTDDLELLLTDSLLYVLDDKAMAITRIDKDTFGNRGRRTIKKPASGLISYDHKLYGYVTDFEETEPIETGKQVNVFRSLDRLREPGASLFRIEDLNPINPFYDAELIESSNNTVVIAREGKSTLTIYHEDFLYRKRIPYIEKRSLGEKIEKDTEFLEQPMMKVVWKKEIMPEYMLIKSVYVEGEYIYIQVQSYKEGEQLIRYTIDRDRFEDIGSLKQGILTAVDNDSVYILDKTDIKSTTIGDVQKCADETVSFYFNSEVFKESCATCKKSFFEWYDFVVRHNIPVQINFEDDSWFGKSEIDSQTLNNLSQWNIWGAITYERDCNGCFDSSISARVTHGEDEGELYTLPESLSSLKKEIGCLN